MSFPSYPSPFGPDSAANQSGLYPLRPLQIGELLAAGLRIAWRHLAVLAPIALIFVVLSSAAEIGLLAANGSLHDYATGAYDTLPANPTSAQISAMVGNLFREILPALAAATVISLISAPILAGFATPFAAAGATTTTGTNGAGLARLHGRLPVLVGLGVVVGLAMSIGYALLIVPGVIVWLMLLPAGPVLAMERSSIADSMRRALVLSKGFKGRLFGVSLLIGLIVGAINLVLTAILSRAISAADPVQHLLLTQGITVVIGALLSPWTAAVTAMLYIDIRMRREGLAEALAATR